MNNRPIKFRAHYDGAIYDVSEIMWSDGTAYIVERAEWGNPENGQTVRLDEIDLIQFTNLTDKNGKEIYEGDLFNCIYHSDGHTDIYEVVYHAEWTGFVLKRHGKCSQIGVRQNVYDCTRYEVIGNSYENPELLTEKAA